MSNAETYETWRSLHDAQGNLAYLLHVFGDTIAEREKYRSVDGIDAVNLYLVNKFRWLPRDVRSMSTEDKLFVLTEEMHNWTAPKEAVSASRK